MKTFSSAKFIFQTVQRVNEVKQYWKKKKYINNYTEARVFIIHSGSPSFPVSKYTA